MAPLSPAAAAALLNEPAMAEIVAADEWFYNGRRRSGQALAWYNRLLLDLLPPLDPAAAFHEIGGGAGLLPIALGLMGRTTANIDHHAARIACGRRILARLAAHDSALPDRVAVVEGTFPQAADAAPLPMAGAIAVTTNFAGTVATEHWNAARLATFLRAVRRRYAGHVFDVCLLGGNWRGQGGWQQVLALVTQVYGTEPRLLHARQDDYARYYHADFTR